MPISIVLAIGAQRQYTYQVLRDESPNARKKTESITNTDMVREVLTTFHEKTQGAGMPQTQLVKAIQAYGVPRTQAQTMVAAGVRDKQWTFESGTRNTLAYYLTGWTPEGTR